MWISRIRPLVRADRSTMLAKQEVNKTTLQCAHMYVMYEHVLFLGVFSSFLGCYVW